MGYTFGSSPNLGAAGLTGVQQVAQPVLPLRFPGDPDGVHLLAQVCVEVALTGSTAKTSLYEVLIPAGAVGPFSTLEIRPFWSYTNSANNKILRAEIGPSAASTAVVWDRTRTTSTAEAPHILLANRGVTNLQLMLHSSLGDAGTSMSTNYAQYTVDFSVDNTLFIYGQLANSGETLKLDALRVAVWGPNRRVSA